MRASDARCQHTYFLNIHTRTRTRTTRERLTGSRNADDNATVSCTMPYVLSPLMLTTVLTVLCILVCYVSLNADGMLYTV